MAPLPRIEVLQVKDGLVLASWQSIFVVVWRSKTTVELVQRLSTALESFASTRPEGISLLVIVEESCELPDTAARDRLAKDMKRHETITRYMALVYEGTGFRAATIRGVVSTLNLVSRQKTRSKVFAQVTEAATWLADPALLGVPADELASAVQEARRAPTQR